MSGEGDVAVVTANEIEFSYLHAGDPSGPLALCLHGFPDSAHTWRHLLPQLSHLGYHAVAPFLRGYAPTHVPADNCYQLGALVADAVALHEALGGDERSVIIGHDWGAMITYGAIAYAPQRWRRAVTMAVPPLPSLASAFLDYEQLRKSFYIFVFQTPLAEFALSMSDLAFVDGLWRDWSPGYNGRELAALAKDSLRDPANMAAAIGYYRAMLDPSGRLPRYEAHQAAAESSGAGCPVLYLHGGTDGCVGAEFSAGAAPHLPPGSEHEVIDGAGHFLHLERPNLIHSRIEGFLRG